MKKLHQFVNALLPPLAWMIFIFYLSSRQRIEVADTDTLNFIIFKSLHMIEYAILFYLVFRAFYLLSTSQNKSIIYIAAAIVSILYAVSDEIHQTFVPSREGTIRDVVIDTLGISLMYIYIRKYFSKIRRYLK